MSHDRRKLSILLVGVGGQGVLTAATMLAAAGHAAGLQVASGQLHGMSQRGGSVECTVIFGGAQSSFVAGAPDVVLAFEQLELLRNVHRLGPGTRAFVNDTRIVPGGLDPNSDSYPSLERIVERSRAAGTSTVVVDGPAIIARSGEPRTLNVAMLGVLAGSELLPMASHVVWTAIESRCAARFVAANRAAFDAGVELSLTARSPRSADELGHGATPV